MALSQEFWAQSAPEPGMLSVEAEALRYIPAGFAFRHNVLAYGVDGPELLVAIPDGEPATVDRIRLLTGMQVRALAVPREVIQKQLSAAYTTQELKRGDDIAVSSPAIRAVDEIHETAARSRASDIHIEPHGTGGRVRQRVNGRLSVVRWLERDLYSHVVSRIRILAGLDVADRRQPQDGRYSFQSEGSSVDARLSSISTMNGERLVIRLLGTCTQRPALDTLGMDVETLRHVRSLVRAPHGFVVICGPTGSGKTTTLYASLGERDADSEHLCTIEDPVEIRLPGVAQVQVSPRAGMTFSKALRAILRQDPDVIMIGEMRDAETANTAISAALSGQLVLTTMHGYDAARAIDRLVDLEVSRPSIAAALTGVVAQRLLRTSCSACCGGSCQACSGTGFSGRTGVFECVEVSADLREAITLGMSPREMLRLLEREGQGSLSHDALRHVMAGRTTANEVQRVLGPTAVGR
ncbi:MAG TPA: GspE/PulE family protein [Candidatus Tyrphobacter sp.]